ncbi:membrane protein [Microbacterium phage Pumpernickel]|uniref:Membrane protein n=1 Tax=Microbacterium phage Pumpernickel TaxID=2885983 RepID=A0AAE8Y8S0_9CAUD|nr:membrane protein [Microbacterium phage Pumpernickel]UDL16041.1 membrane protein [Microbacterium phage Pumpernickel]
MIFLFIVGLIVCGVGFWLLDISHEEDSLLYLFVGFAMCFAGGLLLGSGLTQVILSWLR